MPVSTAWLGDTSAGMVVSHPLYLRYSVQVSIGIHIVAIRRQGRVGQGVPFKGSGYCYS